MMTFRKLSAASSGAVLRKYFTEHSPEPSPDGEPERGPRADSGGRMTNYYTGRDSRASWRPDMSPLIAQALGVDPTKPPSDAALDRLFEAKRADTGDAWTGQGRKISAYDLTLAPHKSVTLAAEFAASPAEAAAIRHAMDKAGEATMRYVAREMGWARKGRGGEDGADPGAVAWVAFRHHTARPTLHVQDGPNGQTYLADIPVPADPHAHTHYVLFNMVVTEEGRIGSLDTQRLHSRVHEFGAYYQARLAQYLRGIGIETAYDKKEKAFVLPVIPQQASDTFSKGRRKREIDARAFAERQGLDWDSLPVENKYRILQTSGLAERLAKHAGKNDREIWVEQARALGWEHTTAMTGHKAEALSDAERYDRAYTFAARHLAKDFRTTAVFDHDKLRMYAARGLIQTGLDGIDDIDRVVKLIEERGITIRGEQAALIVGFSGDTVRVTNTHQIRIEQDMVERAKAAASRRTASLEPAAVTAAIQASGLDFERDPEHGRAQKAAIYALTTGSDLTVLTGVAGAGKTALLRPVVAAYQADTTFSEEGRHVIGMATAWRQARALQETGIRDTYALTRFLRYVENGKLTLSQNSVLVIDEISQIAPRPFLKLLELQQQHGFAIKGLGDREQVQAIEAGDTIGLLRAVLPKEAMPAILTTIRQETHRGREIAKLFRDGQAAQALGMKREDGTALLVGGDQGQVVDRIAELYIQRRDVLQATGDRRGVTISALTNADAGDISQAVRKHLKARGEIANDEVMYPAIDHRGENYTLPLATGDRVRLFQRTLAEIDGKRGIIGTNGDVVTVVGRTESGLQLRDNKGRVGDVEWRRLLDPETKHLYLGFGHALTIDSAQGITSGEHINALPRGSAGITAFKAYTAESRHVTKVWTMVSEAAVHEAVKTSRALGDDQPITAKDLWDRVAEDMCQKPYKSLALELLQEVRRDHEKTVDLFIAFAHRVDTQIGVGRDHAKEVGARVRSEAIKRSLTGQIHALSDAIDRNVTAVLGVAQSVIDHLSDLKAGFEEAQDRIAAAKLASSIGPGPSSSGPSPGL